MRRPCGARQSIHLDLRAGREGGRTLSERVGKHGKVFLEECTESMGKEEKEERGKRKKRMMGNSFSATLACWVPRGIPENPIQSTFYATLVLARLSFQRRPRR